MPLVTRRLGRRDRPAGQLRHRAVAARGGAAGGERLARHRLGQLLDRDQRGRWRTSSRGAAGTARVDPLAARRRGERRRRRDALAGPSAMAARERPVLVYSTAEPAAVKAVQGAARRRARRRAGRARARRDRARPGRARRAPARRRGRRDLGRLRAGARRRAAAHRPADRSRRAVVPCAARGARRRRAAPRAEVGQLRRRRFLHQGLRGACDDRSPRSATRSAASAASLFERGYVHAHRRQHQRAPATTASSSRRPTPASASSIRRGWRGSTPPACGSRRRPRRARRSRCTARIYARGRASMPARAASSTPTARTASR